MRQGAVAVYLDVWHRDLPEFLGLRTNNGDDRMKAHDVFLAVCYPDYFWKEARDNIEGDWYLMCPHEILTVKGCAGRLLWRRIGKKGIRTVSGFPDTEKGHSHQGYYKADHQKARWRRERLYVQPGYGKPCQSQQPKGIIYCSNLCTEIAQNMSAIEQVEQKIEEIDGGDGGDGYKSGRIRGVQPCQPLPWKIGSCG